MRMAAVKLVECIQMVIAAACAVREHFSARCFHDLLKALLRPVEGGNRSTFGTVAPCLKYRDGGTPVRWIKSPIGMQWDVPRGAVGP